MMSSNYTQNKPQNKVKNAYKTKLTNKRENFQEKKKRIRSRITISKGTYKFYLLSSVTKRTQKKRSKLSITTTEAQPHRNQ